MTGTLGGASAGNGTRHTAVTAHAPQKTVPLK